MLRRVVEKTPSGKSDPRQDAWIDWTREHTVLRGRHLNCVSDGRSKTFRDP